MADLPAAARERRRRGAPQRPAGHGDSAPSLARDALGDPAAAGRALDLAELNSMLLPFLINRRR